MKYEEKQIILDALDLLIFSLKDENEHEDYIIKNKVYSRFNIRQLRDKIMSPTIKEWRQLDEGDE